ncbi:hypothetical protein HMPREF9478_02331 [Enterococcus saccharolyticus 30_1]|uniref:Uncharacterized protein n=1 Tax=Enterococcus saccharolyticus 30_1 TaxID=742813 RepID=A0AA87K7J7_9ENTE|nr:hypothetical protein HMPREF9478_02331 [Enterococcus saccharolyticus 30_1]
MKTIRFVFGLGTLIKLPILGSFSFSKIIESISEKHLLFHTLNDKVVNVGKTRRQSKPFKKTFLKKGLDQNGNR